MGLLANVIALGTTRYPEKIARRLRVVNMLAFSGALLVGQFAIRRLPDPAPGMLQAGIVATGIALLMASMPLLHRFGPSTAMIAIATLAFADTYRVTWLAGTGGGYWIAYLAAIPLIVVLLGVERLILSTALSLIAVILLLLLHFTVPFNAGEMPADKLANALTTNLVFYPLMIFVTVLYVTRQTARAEAMAETERIRSDTLLAGILPESVAARLKEAPGRIIADRYDDASVLFADITDFTARAGSMPPEELVRFLDSVFSVFDGLVAKVGAEKIKTNGDGYMVAAGVPTPHPAHARILADLALAMQGATRSFDGNVEIRIGIATGPVVAGVVGTAKFYFDVWGDTVNIASRMESTALSGRIQLAESTAALLPANYSLEPRGTLEIKGKGPMATWYLTGKSTVASGGE